MKTKIKNWIIIPLLACILIMAYVIPAKAQYLPDEFTVGLWHLDKEFGTALDFDGTNEYVVMPDDPSLDFATGDFTIEAWIKMSPVTHRNFIVAKDVSSTTGIYYFEVGYAGGNVALEGKLGACIYETLVPGWTGRYVRATAEGTDVDDNQWHHVAMVVDRSGGIRLFVDGSEEPTEVSITGGVLADINVDSTADMCIGRNERLSAYFDGVIDEVRVSNVARTSFELLTTPTVDSDTVALWHFNEGDGQFVYDATGNGNDGQLGLTSDPGDDDPTWVDSTVNSTLAIDSSSNENHGTIYGATWVDRNIGNALSFDGIDDYVNIPDSNSLDIVGSITLEAWFKVTNFTALPHLYIVSKDTSDSRSYGIAINNKYSEYPSHTPGFVIFGPGGGYSMAWGTTTIQIDTWYHVMGVYDATADELRLYLNGVLESTGTSTVSSILPGIADLQIGARQFPGVWRCFFKGVIDEVRISDDVRSPGLPVYIDIKPGSDPNDICLSKQGLLPVAILSTDAFDATQIEPSTLELGGIDVSERGSKKALKTAYSIKDVDGDGDLDMMAFFSVPDLVTEGGLTLTTTSLELMGTLINGTPIVGIDSVRIVPE